MAFTAKGEYGSAEVIPYLLLLRVVADTHANVVVACSAAEGMLLNLRVTE